MIKTGNTYEEKNNCVNEYLNGKDKKYLSSKYSTSTRTIDRWIKEMNVDKVRLRKAKRGDTIPINIQKEIIEALNSNPIFQGFNLSEWNEPMVIKYIKSMYDIEVNRRMAKALIEDSIEINNIEYEDRVDRDIAKLNDSGHNIILLDYIKVGRISNLEVEPLELRRYTEDKLDVNLVVARASKNIYLDIVISELNIVDKSNIEVINALEKKKVDIQELQRKIIADDKYEVLNKIKRLEDNDNIVFITTYDKDIDKLIRKRSNIKYFIVNDDVYNELLQDKYEGVYGKSVVDYVKDEGNKYRTYESVRDISKVVWGKVDKYILEVTKDKFNIVKNIEDEENKNRNIENNEEIMRKMIKVVNSNFIYNI